MCAEVRETSTWPAWPVHFLSPPAFPGRADVPAHLSGLMGLSLFSWFSLWFLEPGFTREPERERAQGRCGDQGGLPLLPVSSSAQEYSQEAGEQLRQTSLLATSRTTAQLWVLTQCGYLARCPGSLGTPMTEKSPVPCVHTLALPLAGSVTSSGSLLCHMRAQLPRGAVSSAAAQDTPAALLTWFFPGRGWDIQVLITLPR